MQKSDANGGLLNTRAYLISPAVKVINSPATAGLSMIHQVESIGFDAVLTYSN
jgi:hypothetical protein